MEGELHTAAAMIPLKRGAALGRHALNPGGFDTGLANVGAKQVLAILRRFNCTCLCLRIVLISASGRSALVQMRTPLAAAVKLLQQTAWTATLCLKVGLAPEFFLWQLC